MVDPSVEAVAALGAVGADDEVVGQLADGTGVWCGEELEVVEGDLVDGQALGSGAGGDERGGCAAVKAVDVVVLVDGGDGAGVGESVDLAEAFVVTEEEGPIPEDRSADASAELVLAKLGLGAAGLEDVAGVEDIVAEELVGAAVELVGAGAGNDVDDTACGTAGFGGVAVGLDGDFLDAFDVGLDTDGADDALVIVDAVDDVVVEGIVLTVDGEAAGGAPIVGAAAAGEAVTWTLVGSGNELDELDEVTAVEGEILDLLCGDGGADGGAVGLEERCLGFDGDGFRFTTGLETDVGAGAVTGFDGEVGGGRGFEACDLDGDGVAADGKEGELVFAAAVGGGGTLLAGIQVDDGDVGVGDHGAGGVGDGTDDVCGGELRKGAGDKGEEKGEEDDAASQGAEDGIPPGAGWALASAGCRVADDFSWCHFSS